MNMSLRELQVMLLKVMQTLSRRLGTETDPKAATALVGEMMEVNHRITLLGNLLFRQESLELSRKVAAVKAARERLDEAMQDIAELAAFLNTMAAFLGLVDEAIDLAKLV